MDQQTFVYKKGDFKIAKVQTRGYRNNNNLYTSWEVHQGDKLRGVFIHLKDAKAWIQGHTTNLMGLIDQIKQGKA